MFDDRTSFRDIVHSHQQRVYRLALMMTGNRKETEDIVQDAFLRAFRSMSSFRGDADVGTWLYRITVNLSLDALSRRRRDHQTVSLNDPQDSEESRHPVQSADDPESIAGSSLLGRDIDKALGTLSPREKAVFVLRHFEDRPLKEIAEVLSIRVGTVKSLLFRAVTKLQKELSEYREEVDV